MIKIVPPGSYPSDEEPIVLVKFASRGLRGGDRASLLKRAGPEIVAALRDIEVRPGEVLAHLPALGTTETIGPNRNYDGFGAETCRRDHGTFVKHAMAYRRHANTDPGKSYGRVLASAFNEPMGRVELVVGYNSDKRAAAANGGLVADEEMEELNRGRSFPVSMATAIPYDVCLAPQTLVETEQGLRRIDEIQVGDRVKTHAGNFKAVRETMRRDYVGNVVHVSVFGLPEVLTATERHPVWVVSGDQFRRCTGRDGQGKKRRHTFRRGCDSCKTCGAIAAPVPCWTEAGLLRRDDYVVYPVAKPGGGRVGIDRAYLMGIYAGDGCPIEYGTGRHRAGPKKIRGIAVSTDRRDATIIARICSSATAVHGRKQPVFRERNKNAVSIHVHNVSFGQECAEHVGRRSRAKRLSPLVFGLDEPHRLAFLAGVLDSDGSVDRGAHCGIGRIGTVNRTLADQVQKLFWGVGIPATVNFQDGTAGFAPGRSYHVVIPSYGVALLAPYSAKAAGVAPRKRRHGRAVVVGDFIYLPVKAVESEETECTVHNLAMADDETYIAGFVVHNCSGCGNRARIKAEYCDERACTKYGGLKHNLGRVAEDGLTLYMDNVINKWKDISKVDRPADRTAYAFGRLDKAAAAIAAPGVGRDEDLGLTVPPDFGPRDRPRLLAQAKAAGALVVAGRLGIPAGQVVAFAPTAKVPFGGHYAREKVAGNLVALSALRVVLPLHDFLWLACGDAAMAKAAAAEVAPFLPGAYAEILAEGEPALAANPYAAPGRPSLPGMTMAARLAPELALDRLALAKRAAAASLRHPGIQPADVRGIRPPNRGPGRAVAAVARQYALYKIAALAPHVADPEFARMAAAAAAQDLASAIFA